MFVYEELCETGDNRLPYILVAKSHAVLVLLLGLEGIIDSPGV